MKNIIFGIDGIRKNLVGFIFRLVQVLLSFVFLASMFHVIFDYQQYRYYIDKMREGKEIYVFRNNIEDERYAELEQEQYTDNLQELVKRILEGEANYRVFNDEYSITLNEESVERISVTKDFLEQYNLQGIEEDIDIDKLFTLKKMSYENQLNTIKPAIAGSDFHKQYRVGDVITDDYGEQYMIIAFFPKNSKYAQPTQGASTQSLDQKIVIPAYLDMEENDEMIDFVFSCQFEADSAKELQEVVLYNSENKLLDMYLQSYSRQLNHVSENVLQNLVLYGTIGGILLFFSYIGIVCGMISLIKESSYDYAVHLLCGATERDLLIRSLFQFVCMLTAGVVVTLVFYGLHMETLLLICIASAELILVALYANYYMKHMKIVETIGEKG
ncbi:MAG: hypothetical protein K6G01_02005 [Eubacterium sp.]|nr:hypothetical protein [Eubacterium sp.]